MKKLLTALAAALLLFSGCDSTQEVTFGKLVFEIPSSYKVTNRDVRGDTMACTIENGKSEFAYIFIEAVEEDPSIEEAETEILNEYLKATSYDIFDIFVLRSDDIELSQPFDEDDIVSDDDSATPEVFAFFDGTYKDSPYCGALRSTILRNYKITAVAQGENEDIVDELIDNVYLKAKVKN